MDVIWLLLLEIKDYFYFSFIMSKNSYISMLDSKRSTENKIPYGLKKKTSVKTFIDDIADKDENDKFFVIVTKNKTKITSGKTVFYNYPLICVMRRNGNKYTFYTDSILPSFFPIYKELDFGKQQLNTDYGVLMFSYTSSNFDLSKSLEIPEEAKNFLLTNDKYKSEISKNYNIAYDDIYKELSCMYIVEYNKNHDFLSFSISDGKILLSEVTKISRNGEQVSRVFDKVDSSTIFSKKNPRTNFSYKYTVPIEIVNILFSKVLDKNENLSPFSIVEKHKKFILFGKEQDQ